MRAVLTIRDDSKADPGKESVTVTLSFRPMVEPAAPATLAFVLSTKAFEAVALEIQKLKKETP